MARIHYDVTAKQRYERIPVIDPETGEQKRVRVMNRRTGEQKLTKGGKPVTQAVSREDRSRPLPAYACGACGEPIEPGTKYKHVSIRSGPFGGRTLRRHQGCPTWKPSELTTSKMAGVYAAQEDLNDFLMTDFADADEVRDALSTAAEGIREVAEEYRESAENIEQGFGHETEQSAELAERAEELEDWAEEVETASIDDAPEEPEHIEEDDHEEYDDAMETWRDEVREAAAIIDECPV